jgi:hypothetical protein
VGWAADEIAADSALTTLKSPKSRLQEHTQRTTGERPLYRLLEALGPDHEKQFRIEVVVDGRVLGVGEGLSRRIAETSAAAEALEVLRSERQAARAARAAAAAELREADQAIVLLDAVEPAIEAAAAYVGDTVAETADAEPGADSQAADDEAGDEADAPDGAPDAPHARGDAPALGSMATTASRAEGRSPEAPGVDPERHPIPDTEASAGS